LGRGAPETAGNRREEEGEKAAGLPWQRLEGGGGRPRLLIPC